MDKGFVFIPEVSEDFIRAQRRKAKALKKSRWWKQKLSQGKCYYCGGRFQAHELTMDHVVPVIRGGRSEKNNLVPACKECNFEKKHQLGFEFEFNKPGGNG